MTMALSGGVELFGDLHRSGAGTAMSYRASSPWDALLAAVAYAVC